MKQDDDESYDSFEDDDDSFDSYDDSQDSSEDDDDDALEGRAAAAARGKRPPPPARKMVIVFVVVVVVVIALVVVAFAVSIRSIVYMLFVMSVSIFCLLLLSSKINCPFLRVFELPFFASTLNIAPNTNPPTTKHQPQPFNRDRSIAIPPSFLSNPTSRTPWRRPEHGTSRCRGRRPSARSRRRKERAMVSRRSWNRTSRRRPRRGLAPRVGAEKKRSVSRATPGRWPRKIAGRWACVHTYLPCACCHAGHVALVAFGGWVGVAWGGELVSRVLVGCDASSLFFTVSWAAVSVEAFVVVRCKTM